MGDDLEGSSQILALGFFEGLVADNMDATSCIMSALPLPGDVATFVQDMKKGFHNKNISQIFDAITAIRKLPDDIKAMKEGCNTTQQDLQLIARTLKNFSHPKDMVHHLQDDMRVYGSCMLRELADAADFYKNQDEENAGKNVGRAFRRLLIGNATRETALANPKFDLAQVEVILGMAEGFFGSQFQFCALGFLTPIGDAKSAVDDFRNASKERNVTKLLQAFAEFQGLGPELKAAKKGCEPFGTEFKKYAAIVKKYKSHHQLVKHMISDFSNMTSDILNELADGLDLAHKSDSEGAGKKYGLALRQVLIGEVPSMETAAISV